MSFAPVALPITSGTTFYNKYRLVRPIGRGSFGEVWLAQDQAVNHEYAIKVLNAGIGIDQRLREAQVGHAFTHNNLVQVHQADVATDGKVVIAMDYLVLSSLEAKFNSLGSAAYADTSAKGSLITRADFPPIIPNAVCRAVMTSIHPVPAKRFQLLWAPCLDRRALEFRGVDHGGGLVAPPGMCRSIGTLYPIAL